MASHCWACGRRVAMSYRVCCAECGHTWRWRWMLSVHDAWTWWQLGQKMGDWDFHTPWWRRIKVRRPSAIYACPCCSHDL